jgi:AraC family transcriptional regulator of adaptative response/methylated-DNA-[protein]-cysteine methyltransferase
MKMTGPDLRAMGIDPSTARRQFQRYYGMTFSGYLRARRMGLALHEVRRGESVIGAQLESGFNSASGFCDAFRQIFGSPPSRGKEIRCLLTRWIETPLGAMIAIADERGLHLLEFVDRRGLENEISALRKRLGCVIVPGSNNYLDEIASHLHDYFEGNRMCFTVPLVLAGSAFEESVWEKLRGIPPGETRSYADLAKAVGKPAAVRAVGRANGKNCLAIVIPCHRVIRSDGNVSGYGGGVWRKQWLIDHEQKHSARGQID